MKDTKVSKSGTMTRYGVGLFGTEPVRKLCDLAKLAETLGFSNVWVGDSQLIWREAYITFGAIASITNNVVLGSAVTNFVTRSPEVLASAWTSLAEMTNGRVIVGVGTGDSSLRTMSMKPQTLSHLEDSVESFRKLVRGEEVVSINGAKTRLIFASSHRIPVYIAASGPKILELAGKIADGVILLVGIDPKYIKAGLDLVRRGAESAGRTIKDLNVVLWTPTSIAENGKAAREAVRAHIARIVIRKLPLPLDPTLEIEVNKVRAVYDYYHHMDSSADHAGLVSERLVDGFALAGTLDEVREQLKLVVEQGIDQVAIVPFAAKGLDREHVIREFSKLIK